MSHESPCVWCQYSIAMCQYVVAPSRPEPRLSQPGSFRLHPHEPLIRQKTPITRSIAMIQLRAALPRLRPSQLTPLSHQMAPFQPISLTRSLRRSLQKSLQQSQRRCYAKPATPAQKTSRIEDELKRQARAASKSNKEFGA
ncbi:hypothetical protein FALCPG4_003710 [Fusarium falciforme]